MQTQRQQTALEADCLDAVSGLRSSLIDLYATLALDPTEPLEVARRLGLNKNLTWKLSKIISADDGFSAITHIPGAPGWEIFFAALSRREAADGAIARVRAALERFDGVVALHAGDRPNLELILDSLGAAGNGNAPLENSRRLAYQGNSGVWGVQAKVRTAAGFVAVDPSDESRVMISLVGGFVGFRRLRPAVPWPLFRFWTYNDAGALLPTRDTPIEPPADPADPPQLMRRFCSPNLPEIRQTRIGNATEYALAPGEVGNSGVFTCFFGTVETGCTRYRDRDNEHGEFASSINLPVENLLFDLFVDDRIHMPEPPEVLVFARPHADADGPLTRREEYRLPLAERCTELAGRPPAVATPLVPRIGDLVSTVQHRMGPDIRWRGFRLLLPYPPMMSTVVLRWPLAEAPNR